MAATFDYEKRLDDLRIRLLRIHAGGPTEPIKCDILEHELDGSVDYTAISYVWGDNASRLAITCNEQKLYVTENLHGVLMRYRKHGHTGLLWADAICVNQGDKAEKTEQVKTMKTIHELARMVVVWLGEELVSDREGIRLARKLYDALRDQRIKNVVDYSQIDHEGWGIPRADAPSWRSLRTLLGRTWFQRVWVVQEFICAKACTMWCGEIEIQPEVLMVSACLLSKHQNLAMIVAALSNDSTTHYTTRVNEIASFWLLKETIGQSKDQGLKLMGLLWLTLAFRATDPRDKVFALVGLAYGVRSDFVDYTLSTRDVFIRTAKFVIRNNPTNALQLLSFVGQDRPDHLPSWVPDWTPSRQGLSPLTGRYYNSIPPPPLLKSAAEIQFLGGDEIAVKGKIIDTVSSLFICPYSDPSKTVTQKLKSWFVELSTWINTCARSTQESPQYGSEREKSEVFWRALIFNTTGPKGLEVPDEVYAESYRAYHELIEYELMLERITP